jgi:hypothetical protein
MFYTFLVYVHLISTCVALGTIVITDLRLMAKVMGYRVVIPRPERFETFMISAAFALLYLTGAAIVWLALQDNPQYLHNEKLQAKLVLVLLLSANAVFLHQRVFPFLSRSMPVSAWKRIEWAKVASGVSLSNSIWFFCGFLGIARVWNNTVSIWFVLTIAVAVWMIAFVAVNSVLFLASRDAPMPEPDWIDSVKARVSDFTELSAHRGDSGPVAFPVSDRRRYPRPRQVTALA